MRALLSLLCLAFCLTVSAERVLNLPQNKQVRTSGYFSLIGCLVENQSSVTVLRKDGKLHFQLENYYPEGTVLETSSKFLFLGECAELYLSNGKTYYHFAVDLNGEKYQTIEDDTKRQYDSVIISAEKQPGRWLAKFTVPEDIFGNSPKEGTKWKVNFCRMNAVKGVPPINSSWTGASNFRHISQMGTLVFTDKTEQPPCPVLTRVLQKDRMIKFQFRENPPKKISVFLEPKGRRITCREHDGWYIISDLWVPLKNFPEIELRFDEVSLNAFFQGKEEFFRPGKFYLTETMEQMPCHAEAIPGTLSVLDGSGKEIAKQKVTEKDFSIRTAALPFGRMLLKYKTEDGRWTLRAIRKIKPVVDTGYGEHPILSVDGTGLKLGKRPYFLLGISTPPAYYYDFKPSFSYLYGKGADGVCAKICGLPGGRYKAGRGRLWPLPDALNAQIRAALEQKPERSDIMYRIVYEAGIPGSEGTDWENAKLMSDQVAVYDRYYKLAKSIRPDLIFSLEHDALTRLSEYGKCCDVMEYAGPASYSAGDMMRYLETTITEFQKAVPGKPLILWLGGSIPNPVCRTPEELHCAVYISMLRGLAGNIIHMGHTGIPQNRTRFWSFLSGLGHEVKAAWKDFSAGKAEMINCSPALLCAKVAHPDGKAFLLLINQTDSPILLKKGDLPGLETDILFAPYEPVTLLLDAQK